MIEIINLKKEKPEHAGDFTVDRSSVLGNPFQMSYEGQRDIACDMYDEYFPKRFIEDKHFHKAVMNIVEYYKVHKRIRLFCWCVPKRCHAQTIANFIEEKANV